MAIRLDGRWIENSPEMRSQRCRVCNTYPDDVILGYRPVGAHLADILDSVKSLRIVTANDGFTVFNRRFHQVLLEIGVAEDHVRVVGLDAFTFDLEALPRAPSADADVTKAKLCTECGRLSPIWHTKSHDAPMVLQTVPSTRVARSAEIFGLADLRRPEIYVADDAYARFGLPRHAYDVVVAQDRV
jgi:hypothetical protein